MMDSIIKYLIIILLILQIIIVIHMLICHIKGQKEDKKFWAQMDIAIKDQIKRYNTLYPDEPLSLKEDSTSEQNK